MYVSVDIWIYDRRFLADNGQTPASLLELLKLLWGPMMKGGTYLYQLAQLPHFDNWLLYSEPSPSSMIQEW